MTHNGKAMKMDNQIYVYPKPHKSGRKVDQINGKNFLECIRLFCCLYGFEKYYYTFKREK